MGDFSPVACPDRFLFNCSLHRSVVASMQRPNTNWSKMRRKNWWDVASLYVTGLLGYGLCLSIPWTVWGAVLDGLLARCPHVSSRPDTDCLSLDHPSRPPNNRLTP